MVRTLLLRGMLVGLVAGLVVFAFARWVAEPHVDQAIAFEAGIDRAKGESPEPEMVSRRIQKNIGLLTGLVVYGTALGGIFGLVFAYARGRISNSNPRVLSTFQAGLGFVAVVLIPALKYPASPPAVGSPETIGIRTAAYFLLIALSLVLMILALKIRNRWIRSMGEWNATLLATLLYAIFMGICTHFLPVIDEVPAEFSASLLWKFRIASLGMQVVMWGVLGLLFGSLTERAERHSNSATA